MTLSTKEKTYDCRLVPPAAPGQAAPQMTKAEIYTLLEARYGRGFATWFIDQLDQDAA